jgi:hypothetical protein
MEIMEIPKDILRKIDELFPSMEDNVIAKHLLEEIRLATANVGFAQLIRSILTLSDGSLSAIRKIIQSDFYGDARDVIKKAEDKLGNPGHFFIPAFEEIEKNKK